MPFLPLPWYYLYSGFILNDFPLKNILIYGLIFCSWLPGSTQDQSAINYFALTEEAVESLNRGISFFRSLAIEGGYVYHYTLDLKEKWGEGKTDDFTIEVQPPGTPAVGSSFLRAYQVTGNPGFLEAAREAGNALIKGQNAYGGWSHKIYFNRPNEPRVSFDDNQTQSAISFLIMLDQYIDQQDLTGAIERAMDMMLKTQLASGAWPHQYPPQGNYHDYATFNDRGINDCVRVMLEAVKHYDRDEYRQSLDRVGRFILISQLPPPQPGWAQQYNEYLQPAWARSFEPPSVCPLVTVHNLNTLMDLYLFNKDRKYLEPIPDAIRWLKDSRLPNGKWGRFLELGTNKPLYYDRDRIRKSSLDELSLERKTGYAYEVDLTSALTLAENRFNSLDRESDDAMPGISEPEDRLKELTIEVKAIIESQDDQGRWIVRNDRFRKEVSGERWNGEYRIEDRISSALFNQHIAKLCEFLELSAQGR